MVVIQVSIIPGEVLACPSATHIDGVMMCLLDCYDVVRIDRLRARGLHVDQCGVSRGMI